MAAPPGLQHVAAARLAGAFVVLGAGTVTFRKGVDLFLAVAMAVCRAALAPIHFVWIGRGYLPDEDMTYSIYLREQVERSGLTGHVTFVDELPDLEPAYALADAFLLASRLDPLPNVSIDAALRGIPIVCFQGASGMAEILSADPATEACVVGHLDIAAASGAILGLAADDALRQRMASATLSLGRSVFDMNAYCAALDTLGRDASGRFAQLRQDADMLCRTGGAGEETTGVPPAFDTPRQNARRQIARRRLLDARSEWCSAADAGTAAAPSGLPVMLA
jgi:glycosyltransferase involved in cell wall biosynthesis